MATPEYLDDKKHPALAHFDESVDGGDGSIVTINALINEGKSLIH